MADWINENHMRLALEAAEISKTRGEFPFGAVLTHEGKVLVVAENGEHRKADVTAHAEMMAISEACWKLARRDLSDCIIYSSAEPCPMCSAAIFQSNIPRVAFGLFRDDLPHLFRRRKIRIAQLAEDWDYQPEVIGGILREDAIRPLNEIASAWYFEPLGMTNSTFNPVAGAARVAPTELTEQGALQGEVHDESARTLQRQGIVPGCAGLFSTASDILWFAEMILAEGKLAGRKYFDPATIQLMLTNQLGGIGQTAGLGWEINRPEVMGRAQRDGLLMKSGFTGCWVAIDPASSSALVHLSNRTYPHRPAREPIHAFWRQLNEEFFL